MVGWPKVGAAVRRLGGGRAPWKLLPRTPVTSSSRVRQSGVIVRELLWEIPETGRGGAGAVVRWVCP